MKKYILILLFLVVLSVVVSFRSGTDNMTFAAKMNLSEYGFFAGKLADQQPVSGVIRPLTLSHNGQCNGSCSTAV